VRHIEVQVSVRRLKKRFAELIRRES
jgi:antitoxin (DNA-binding transcriptional repressor) of toxin-antitoxin stability system